MKAFFRIALITLLCLSFAVNCSRQETFDELNEKIVRLYQQGRYGEALEVAKRSLKLAEETHAPDHPDVATALNNLALLYGTQGKYAEIEPLYKRKPKHFTEGRWR